MAKKALITGITGFAGSYLADYLIASGVYDLYGNYVNDSTLKSFPDFKKRITLTKLDLTDKEAIASYIATLKPDIVFHLAALTSPAESFKDPSLTITNNINAELYLLEALRSAHLIETRVLITSSAEVYGLVGKDDLPVDEEAKLSPVSPYAVSKIAQDYLGLQYFLSYKLPIIRVRPFNHIGPRQGPSFVVASFAKKIAEIEKGKSEPVLTVGNLSARRDFTDVRDIVRAYALLLEEGKPGEVYNIGSGESHAIEEVLHMLLALSSSSIKVTVDQALFRPLDIPDLVCDATKCTNDTGWKPEISLAQSLKETLEYWREIV